jgi:ATP-dependent HslUV protease subunit HslV
MDQTRPELLGTTILALRDEAGLVIGGDGQVTFGDTVLKATARKVRRLGDGKVLGGFAGSTADSFALFERFEEKYKKNGAHFLKAAVDLAKEWRTDKALRQLQAMLLVGDAENLLILTGNGDVVEPEGGLAAIGSGGNFALAAARALKKHSSLKGEDLVREALTVAADLCIHTNHNFHIERL